MSKYYAILMLSLLAPALNVCAQCVPGWSTSQESVQGEAFAILDQDGPGPVRPVLVAGGFKTFFGAIPEQLIGTYDGRVWRPLGEGLGTEGSVRALCVSSTSGVGSPEPGLYAGGNYRFVGEPLRFLSHWDGSAWSVVGERIGSLHSLLMFDEDGPGPNEPSLFVGGGLVEIGGLDDPGLARWDGTSFSLVGGSLGELLGRIPLALSMTIFDDDGSGPRPPALYVAGSFRTAGGRVVNNIARWDGTNWEALGSGLSSGVRVLAVYDADDDGPEPAMLYAGSRFRTPTGSSSTNFSRWDGRQWSEVPGYDGGGVTALHVFDDDGDGPNKPSLFVSGLFHSVGGVNANGVARWDGTRWHPMGLGLGGINFPFATAMTTFDEDGDPATPPGLYLGGSFLAAGGRPAPALARWGCPLSTCYADCEASTGLGTLDIFDFLCFQNAFVNTDPYACDCDVSTGNGVCDMLDFLCFQNAFVARCP